MAILETFVCYLMENLNKCRNSHMANVGFLFYNTWQFLNMLSTGHMTLLQNFVVYNIATLDMFFNILMANLGHFVLNHANIEKCSHDTCGNDCSLQHGICFRTLLYYSHGKLRKKIFTWQN